MSVPPSNMYGEHTYNLYTPYEVKKTIVNTRKHKVPAKEARPIEYLVINLGGNFEQVGGDNEAIGGDVTKMGQ